MRYKTFFLSYKKRGSRKTHRSGLPRFVCPVLQFGISVAVYHGVQLLPVLAEGAGVSLISLIAGHVVCGENALHLMSVDLIDGAE